MRRTRHESMHFDGVEPVGLPVTAITGRYGNVASDFLQTRRRRFAALMRNGNAPTT